MTHRNSLIGLKNGLVALVTFVVLTTFGCSPKIYPSTDTNIRWEVRDSVRYIDSLVPVPVPVERIVDIVPVYDTLKLETTLAKAQAYVDTVTHTIRGSIENRKDSIKTVIKVKEHTVVEYRDSVSVKTVPVEVEVFRKVVPSWCWWLLVFNVLVLLVLGFKIYLKFKQ